MANKIKTTVTGRNLSETTAKTLSEEVFGPLANLINLETENQVRKPLQKALTNILKLDDEEKILYQKIINKVEKDVNKAKADLKASGKENNVFIDAKALKKVELDYLAKHFGNINKKGELAFTNDKGVPVTVQQLKGLIKVAEGTEPGNWLKLAIIGRVLKKDPKSYDKGHEAASIISIKIAGVLRSPELSNPDRLGLRRDLEKLLDISRQIDHAEQSILGDYKGSRNGYEIIGSILNSDLNNSEIEADVSKKIVEELVSGKVSSNLTVTFEAKKINNLKSIAQKIIGEMLSKMLNSDKLNTDAQGLLDKIDATNIKGSPTLRQVIDNILLGIIAGNYKKLKKPRGHKLGKLKNKLKKPKFKSIGIKEFNAKQANKSLKNSIRFNPNTVDILNIKNLINGILAERVEAEMAKSGSSDGRLRYQTGRFAESANLLTLTRTQAGILAGTYTYLRDPYDVFLPGHKMGTPKRDPRIYVEGAIRKSAMQILKQRFPGIALELR